MDFAKLESDLSKEVQGVKHELDEKGAYIVVARAMNPAHREAVKKLVEPYQQQIELGTFPPEKDRELIS